MDSQALTREMLKHLIEEARLQGAHRIKRIVLEVGALSGLDCRELRENFEQLSRDTPAEGAVLAITEIPLTVRCLFCSREYDAGGFRMTCSSCGGIASELVSGNELRVKEMEVA